MRANLGCQFNALLTLLTNLVKLSLLRAYSWTDTHNIINCITILNILLIRVLLTYNIDITNHRNTYIKVFN